MSVSLSSSLLRKMMLWYVLFATLPLVAHAEDFGITRRTPAQSQPNPTVLPYVVRIIAYDANGQSFGTGSYVGTYGEYGVILTNSHVVCETEGLVHVHFPSGLSTFGFSSFGAVIKSDPQWDLALIAINKPPHSIPLLPVSQTPSKPGDPLWIVGFGSGMYRIAGGQCVRYLAPEPKNGTDPLYEIVEVSVSARKGDSGGPILNQKGELAGVLFGSDMIRNTAGSYCERVSRFLKETQNDMARLPSRPETHFASVEKNGPLHTLQESRNAVPQGAQSSAVPPRSGFSDSSASSFGIRSSSRSDVAPTSNAKPQPQPQTSPGGQSPATIRMPLTSLSSIPTAGREVLPKVESAFPSEKIEQIGQLTPLETISMPMVIPVADISAVDRYHLKLSADRNDWLFSLFISFNVCLAAGLTYIAVQLLRV